MDEYVIKQKVQRAFPEPRAPEGLIQKVILRAQAIVMGVQAQKQLKSASEEKLGQLASRALIGQLAMVSELPQGAQPELLARQLQQAPAFQSALCGGNVASRLNSGELIRQVTGQSLSAEQATAKPAESKMEGPTL